MGESTDRNQALRLLDGLENGGLDMTDADDLARELDPVLVHAIIRYLREGYPASDPAASGVLGRVVELTKRHPAVVRASQQGANDPVAAWFRSEYEFRQFKGRGAELLDLLIDKLES